MNNPDNYFTYKPQKPSLYKTRQFVMHDFKNAIQAMCIAVSDENKKRYENGLKPISPYYYAAGMLQESLCQIFDEKDNGKLSKSEISRQMMVNRGTIRRWELAAKEMHNEQV